MKRNENVERLCVEIRGEATLCKHMHNTLRTAKNTNFESKTTSLHRANENMAFRIIIKNNNSKIAIVMGKLLPKAAIIRINTKFHDWKKLISKAIHDKHNLQNYLKDNRRSFLINKAICDKRNIRSALKITNDHLMIISDQQGHT